ncbi:MAG: hypothetical protein Q7R87_03840 [Nanoarchaeota archaeon]|nr:hypothetical protein [Nanoarchaeota archaeon]
MSASLLDTRVFLSQIGFEHPWDFKALVSEEKIELSRNAGHDVGTPNTIAYILDKRITPHPELTTFELLRETGTLIYLTEGPLLADTKWGNHVFGELMRFHERMHSELAKPVINYPLLSTYCLANRLGPVTRDRLAETIRAHRSVALPSEARLVDYASFN